MKQYTSGSAMARYGCRCSGRCAGLGFTKNRNLRAAPGADAGGAARRAERFRFPTPAVASRGEARPHRPGPGVRFKVSRAGERMGSKRRYAGRSAVPRHPRFQAGREVPRARDCKAATGKGGRKDGREARVLISLRQVTHPGGATGGVFKSAPPSPGKSGPGARFL